MQGKPDRAPEGERSPQAAEDWQHNLLLHKCSLGLPARSQRYSTTVQEHAMVPEWKPCPDLCVACLLMLRAVYGSCVLPACVLFILQKRTPAVAYNDKSGMLLACVTQHSSD